ncbi:hypothetical protein CHISP_1362 [Chitinispirillum alkaliphilum]|nr:hypothetical protein CHISP_1362 [Chitinispirillum alkaliphilum]
MNCSKCKTPLTPSAKLCSACGHISGSLKSVHYSGANPWEGDENQQQQPLKTLLKSILGIMVKPKEFFSEIREKKNSGILQSIIFALFCTGIAISAELLWTIIISGETTGSISDRLTPSSLINSPIMLFVKLFFATIYIHSVAFVFRFRKKPLSSTFKIVAYSQAAFLFRLVPLAGNTIAIIAWIYLIVLGISIVHSTSRVKTGLALLLPAFILPVFLFIFLSLALVGGLLPELLYYNFYHIL